ncbi:hypothetical protein HOY82DRAFT_625638 [Tuber indicum]|nr:hypothetical protein HOY82DRAFT_625638 [Tuber indicum]
MPRLDYSQWHNTFIYASDNRTERLAGLFAGESITNSNLYSMLEILCSFSDAFDVHGRSEIIVDRNEEQLQPGDYYIVTHGSITLNHEVPLFRTRSLATGRRSAAFRIAVRERDGGCAVTGRQARLGQFGNWRGFQAAHIFPLAYEKYWKDNNFGRWITIPPTIESHGSINSVQNGIMLINGLHELFDGYEWSINPKDNYKIVCFTPAMIDFHIAGRSLDETFIDNPLRPVDELLEWHFHQAVLVNMKVVGDSSLKNDSPQT